MALREPQGGADRSPNPGDVHAAFLVLGLEACAALNCDDDIPTITVAAVAILSQFWVLEQ